MASDEAVIKAMQREHLRQMAEKNAQAQRKHQEAKELKKQLAKEKKSG